MSIVKILVPVSGGANDAVALATAFAAAKPFAAHVAAVFIHPDPREAVPYGELGLSPEVVQNLIDCARDVSAQALKAARASFVAQATETDARIVAAPVKNDSVTCSLTERTARLSSQLEEEAKLADLVVFPPLELPESSEMQDAFIRILTSAKRPVLLSPKSVPASIGRHIAVGWDGGFAASHALTAALPFLLKAEAVELLSVGDEPDTGQTGEAVRYLSLHAIAATHRNARLEGRGIPQALLAAAGEGNCDLLVIGGYGHSRTRETIFGGVTNYIVSHAELPVLMVH